MKQLGLILAFVLMAAVAYPQAQKTFVKTFNLKGSNAVVLNLEGKVVVKEWSESLVRVMTNIEVNNTSDNTLKAIIAAGRYRIASDYTGGALTLQSNSREREITIQGQTLKEDVTYTVYVPGKVNVEVVNYDAQSNNEIPASNFTNKSE